MSEQLDWHSGIEHAEISDIGLRRSNNQDSMAVFMASSEETWQCRGHVFLVCDGMGAHAAGELASKLAADTIPLTYHKLKDKSPPLALKLAIEDANRIIFNRGKANPDFEGMGTTSSSLVLTPQGALLGQVGDSRIYRLRGPQLEQLSFDHSLDWELTRTGRLPDENMPTNIPKNIITRSLGPSEDVEVDIEGPLPIVAGDLYLLCSDGLSGPVNDREIGAIMGCLPPEEAVEMLVNLANLRGGPDNITVIIARSDADYQGQFTDISGSDGGIHPAVWAVLGLGLLLSGALAMGVHLLAGPIGLVVTLAAVFLTISMTKKPTPEQEVFSLSHPPGPHGCWQWAPDEPLLEELAKTLKQLRDAATEEDWKIDWSKLEGFEQQAGQFTQDKKYVESLRQYCAGIIFMMRELKKQGQAEREAL